MAGYFTESNYENAVLQLLNEELGYNYIYGPDVERDYHSPLYEDVLLPSLQRINKSLPVNALYGRHSIALSSGGEPSPIRSRGWQSEEETDV